MVVEPTAGKVATIVVNTAAAQPLLLNFEALPAWLQDNTFIRTGYRRPQYSWFGCARSVFGYLHNESVNIHTHLFGALGLFYLLLNAQHTHAEYTNITWHDSAVFRLALAAEIFCLGISALFHAAICHSPNVSRRCNTLDYLGIIVLAVGSFYPALYYGFFCDHRLQILYAANLTLSGIAAAYVLFDPLYATPGYRWSRTLVFFALGICAVVPIMHVCFSYGLERARHEMGVLWVILCGSLYVMGAIIYACRVPERWMPGRFDYFGSSHQVLHVCVVLATLANYKGVLTSLEYWHGQQQGICPM